MGRHATPVVARFPLRRNREILGAQLSDLRWLLIVLGTAAVLLQAQLWLSEGGYRKTMKLRDAVAEQRAMNERLRERNSALDAEVINLKQGIEAAEERARTDLGLIGPRETFYQVVPDVDYDD